MSRMLLVAMLLTSRTALSIPFCCIQRFARLVAVVLLDPSGINAPIRRSSPSIIGTNIVSLLGYFTSSMIGRKEQP